MVGYGGSLQCLTSQHGVADTGRSTSVVSLSHRETVADPRLHLVIHFSGFPSKYLDLYGRRWLGELHNVVIFMLLEL